MRIFKIWLQIRIPCKKVWMQTAFLFFIFLLEVIQINEKGCKIALLFFCLIFQLKILFLIMFLSKYEKKRPSLHSYFFERNPNLRSDFKNSHFEILAFLYLTLTFDPPGLSQKFWKLYFLKFYQYWLGISNRILH